MAVDDERGGFEQIGDDLCKHGNFLGTLCQACLEESKENQPAWRTIKRLQSKSGFRRDNENNPSTDIEIGENKFRIETIESGASPNLAKVQQFFEKTFDPAEVDPEETLRSAVDGRSRYGTQEIKYKIIAIKDQKGDVVSVVTGGNLDLLDEQGKDTGKTVFMVAYASTLQGIRQGGLAREAYISALMSASADAQARGRNLGFAAGECTYTSEKFWNKVGWRRVYGKTGDKEFTEVPYVQPPLDWNLETGKPEEEAGDVPEHLMIDSFSQDPPSKKEVAQTIKAFYRWNNYVPEVAFGDNKQAIGEHREYVQKLEAAFEGFLDKSGQLLFLDILSREKARKAGLGIIEYSAADHGNAGEEDF